jgi:hypothetical protein
MSCWLFTVVVVPEVQFQAFRRNHELSQLIPSPDGQVAMPQLACGRGLERMIWSKVPVKVSAREVHQLVTSGMA